MRSRRATLAADNYTIKTLGLPATGRKKVTAAFDGGRLTSDGDVMLLAAAERRMGFARKLAGLIADPCNPLFTTHSVADILRIRMLAIACGYEDADDLAYLRDRALGRGVGAFFPEQVWLPGQFARTGMPTIGSSLIGAMVSSVI